MEALRCQYPSGFDIVLGADVVYAEEFVPQLIKSAKALMKPCHEVSPRQRLSSVILACSRRMKAVTRLYTMIYVVSFLK